jgi:ribosomal protein L10
MLDDLAHKGEWEVRNEIRKSIRETDAEIAVHQNNLIK